MSLLRRLTLLPLGGLVACTTVYTYPNGNLPPDDPPPTTPAPPVPRPPGTPRRVFVTSAVYQGGYLGGLDGADAECGKRATAAGLTGSFKAWLSTVASPAADRLTHSTDPYTLVDGTRVADSWADLIHADLQHAIDADERGVTLPPPADPMLGGAAWTGTEFDGVTYVSQGSGDMTCNGWTDLHGYGMAGDRRQTTDQWSVNIGLPCTFKASLYCLEQ